MPKAPSKELVRKLIGKLAIAPDIGDSNELDLIWALACASNQKTSTKDRNLAIKLLERRLAEMKRRIRIERSLYDALESLIAASKKNRGSK